MNLVAVGLAGCLGLMAFTVRADLEVSAAFTIHAEAEFDAPLASHGTWVTVGSYGRCWRPSGIAVSWRPYSYGHWVWTDCGWYWESDEPWGWACYHYGNWVFDEGYGWVWIPGIEWGPAWVTWRVGGGYIGWAPLAPPRVTVVLGAPHFVFVQSARFGDPVQPSRLVVNNTTIINNTTVINNVKRESRSFDGRTSQPVIVNEGPGIEVVQKATGKKFAAVKIQEVVRQTPAPVGLPKKMIESPGKDKQPATSAEKPKLNQERKLAPEEKPGKAKPPVAPEEKPAQPGQPKFTPGQPSSPGGPPVDLPKPKVKKSGKDHPDGGDDHGKGKP